MPKGSEDKTPRKMTFDFDGVDIKRGGGGVKLPEGDYLLEVRGIKLKKKRDDATRKYLEISSYVVKPTSQAGKGPVIQRLSTSQEALFMLRTWLVDLLGEKHVPASSVEVPFDKIVAKKMQFGATVVDGEPYNNKVKSEVQATFSKAEYEELAAPSSDDDEDEEEEDEEEEDEEEAPKKKAKKADKPEKKKAKKKVDDDDEEDDEDEIDVDDI